VPRTRPKWQLNGTDAAHDPIPTFAIIGPCFRTACAPMYGPALSPLGCHGGDPFGRLTSGIANHRFQETNSLPGAIARSSLSLTELPPVSKPSPLRSEHPRPRKGLRPRLDSGFSFPRPFSV
jgi:hypothetical protein